MKLRVLYHGNCFDGSASASLFARFFRERLGTGAMDVAYTPLQHKGDPQPIKESFFDGDVNACVDFRYSQSSRLDWWFDHHTSAFQLPGDEEHFRADTSGQKFHDPEAKSCTKYLANMLAARFGWNIDRFAELLHWAEIIDGALFPSAAMAVELKEPALHLMTWVENNRNPSHADRFIEDLTTRTFSEIAESPYVAEALTPLLERHTKNIEIVRQRARLDGEVIVSDLTADQVGSINKFIVYYLYPEARYAVSLLAIGDRYKLSVGTNPWRKSERTHDIAKLCERYGGGGHPAVGAISLPKTDLAHAQQVAAEVLTFLQH
jgi:hypothetical protein